MRGPGAFSFFIFWRACRKGEDLPQRPLKNAERGRREEKIKIIVKRRKREDGGFFDGEVVRSGSVVWPLLCLSFAFAWPIYWVGWREDWPQRTQRVLRGREEGKERGRRGRLGSGKNGEFYTLLAL